METKNVQELMQSVYDRAVELENASNEPYQLYFLTGEEWYRHEDGYRFERQSYKMKIAIRAKSVNSAVCLILLAQQCVNLHNTLEDWTDYFRQYKPGTKIEEYVKNKYSEITYGTG
jgi:hypothetical protein